MNQLELGYILLFYGVFLISCGIIAVFFIGKKAKTALISGSISGGISLFLSYLNLQQADGIAGAGLFLCLFLTGIFSWRGTMTLFKLLEMVQQKHEEVTKKAIAFLIIWTMAIVSIVCALLQFINLMQ